MTERGGRFSCNVYEALMGELAFQAKLCDQLARLVEESERGSSAASSAVENPAGNTGGTADADAVGLSEGSRSTMAGALKDTRDAGGPTSRGARESGASTVMNSAMQEVDHFVATGRQLLESMASEPAVMPSASASRVCVARVAAVPWPVAADWVRYGDRLAAASVAASARTRPAGRLSRRCLTALRAELFENFIDLCLSGNVRHIRTCLEALREMAFLGIRPLLSSFVMIMQWCEEFNYNHDIIMVRACPPPALSVCERVSVLRRKTDGARVYVRHGRRSTSSWCKQCRQNCLQAAVYLRRCWSGRMFRSWSRPRFHRRQHRPLRQPFLEVS